MRAYLADTPCLDNLWVLQTLPRPDGQGATVSEEPVTQGEALSAALDLSDTFEGTQTGQARNELDSSGAAVEDAVTALDEAVTSIGTAHEALSQKADRFRQEQEFMRDQVATAFDEAATATGSAVNGTVSNQFRLVST